MKSTTYASTFIFSLLFITAINAPMAVSETLIIVHPSNNNTIDKNEIARLFLDKSKAFPDGTQAIPIDQNEGSPVKVTFLSDIVLKTSFQIKAYWGRKMFTGKGRPPKSVVDDNAVKALVSSNPNTIGYIDSKSVDSSVKEILRF